MARDYGYRPPASSSFVSKVDEIGKPLVITKLKSYGADKTPSGPSVKRERRQAINKGYDARAKVIGGGPRPSPPKRPGGFWNDIGKVVSDTKKEVDTFASRAKSAASNIGNPFRVIEKAKNLR